MPMEIPNSQIEVVAPKEEILVQTGVLRPEVKTVTHDSSTVLRRRDFINKKSGTIELPEGSSDYTPEDKAKLLKMVEMLREEDIKKFELLTAEVKMANHEISKLRKELEEINLKFENLRNSLPKRNVDGIQAKSNDDVIAEVTERSLPIRPMSNVPPLESTVTLPPDTQSTAVTSDTIIGDTTQVGSKVPFIRRMSVGLDDLTKLQ